MFDFIVNTFFAFFSKKSAKTLKAAWLL